MLNFSLGHFWNAWDLLQHEIHLALAASTPHPNGDREVDQRYKDRVRANLAPIIAECANLFPEDIANAVIDIEMMWRVPVTHSRLREILERFASDAMRAAKREHFFHYPRQLAIVMLSLDAEWKSVLEEFPSSRRDIEAGNDCYALGDYAGCVFHMMGLAELGLRAIAKERGVKSVGKHKPIEWGTWQDVFAAIEGQLKIVRQASAGPKRDAALSFYDVALSDLRRLQGYRDPALHFRASYDKGEAYDAMHRTKSLMQTLATKLNEAHPHRIRWGL